MSRDPDKIHLKTGLISNSKMMFNRKNDVTVMKRVGEEIASRTLLESEKMEALGIFAFKNQLNRIKNGQCLSNKKGLILYCLTKFKDGE